MDRVYTDQTFGKDLLALTGNATSGYTTTFAIHLPIRIDLNILWSLKAKRKGRSEERPSLFQAWLPALLADQLRKERCVVGCTPIHILRDGHGLAGRDVPREREGSA